MLLVVFLICHWLSIDPANGLSCKDDSGRNVAWYILYKLPQVDAKANSGSKEFSSGDRYAYISSNSKDYKWKLSDNKIGSDESMLGRTLQPIYRKPDKLSFLMYNDDPPHKQGKCRHQQLSTVFRASGLSNSRLP